MPENQEIALVIDDGLSNTRMRAFYLGSMEEIPGPESWTMDSTDFTGTDGKLYFGIPGDIANLVSELNTFEGKKDISIIASTFRGATGNLIGSDGALFPPLIIDKETSLPTPGVISYLNKYNEYGDRTNEVFDRLMGPEDRYKKCGLPKNFDGGLIIGRTLVNLSINEPDLIQKAGGFVIGSEIIARQLVYSPISTENLRLGPEITYMQCHTGLYNFERKEWSQLAKKINDLMRRKTGRDLIGDLMPGRFSNSYDVFGTIDQNPGYMFISAEKGFSPDTKVLIGIHDSAGADIPVTAAFRQKFGDEEFVHFQAGSWGMARVIGREGDISMPKDGYDRSVLLQGDLYGNAVLTALTPTGVEWKHYAGKEDEQGNKGIFLEKLNLDELPTGKYDKLEEIVNEREIFITPGIQEKSEGIGPYPNSICPAVVPNGLYDDKTGETAYITLNLETSIITAAGIELVSAGNKSKVVLSAGAAADPLYRALVATLLSDREVYFVTDGNGNAITETTTHGGLVLAKANLTGEHPYDVDVSPLGYEFEKIDPIRKLIEPLEHYREEFEKRCKHK